MCYLAPLGKCWECPVVCLFCLCSTNRYETLVSMKDIKPYRNSLKFLELLWVSIYSRLSFICSYFGVKWETMMEVPDFMTFSIYFKEMRKNMERNKKPSLKQVLPWPLLYLGQFDSLRDVALWILCCLKEAVIRRI